MAKSQNSSDTSELMDKLNKTVQPENPLPQTTGISMRDLVIQTTLQIGLARAIKIYMPDGRIGDRRVYLEKAGAEVINLADMMANAYDQYVSEKNRSSNA